MKSCREMEARLNEYVDGQLDDDGRRETERHLESCAGCAGAVAGLRALREAAAALPRELTPPRDLWPGIRAAVSSREAARSRFPERSPRPRPSWRWAAGLAAAAALLVVVTAGVTSLLIRNGRPEPRSGGDAIGPSGSAILADYRAAEIEYARASRDLLEVLEQRRDRLAPETLEVLDENLRIIDEAIRQMWIALENDPNHAETRHLFNSLYRRKVTLLQRALRLPPQG